LRTSLAAIPVRLAVMFDERYNVIVDAKTSDKLGFAISAPLSFYQRADILMRLITSANVDEILQALPDGLRTEFVAFARATYAPSGPRQYIGRPLPQASLQAIRTWLTTHLASP
jgi:hypothetical protein